MASAPVALILGGGPRIGWSVANKLRSEGYKVAIGSRNPNTQRAAEADVLPVSVDVSNTKSVQDAFETVKQKLGVPGVVVYNSAALSFPADTSDPFASITPETLQSDMAVNVIGGYAALRESVAGFKSLPAEARKVFIATGNVTPFQPIGMALTLGVGKAALVHAIQIAAKVYQGDGSRFYFASQVTANGGPVPYPEVDGDAHGKVYSDLINRVSQGNWDVRFLGDGQEVNKQE